jgi:hypothetical protein
MPPDCQALSSAFGPPPPWLPSSSDLHREVDTGVLGRVQALGQRLARVRALSLLARLAAGGGERARHRPAWPQAILGGRATRLASHPTVVPYTGR